MSTIKMAITDRLTRALVPDRLEVEDVSEQHRGHGGYREGVETHFNVLIVSGKFVGCNRVARQRLVFSELSEWMNNPIHALSIKAMTPEEAGC